MARNGSGVYNATKHGVGAFSESLRQEVTGRHVRVSLVEPGAVATELPSHNRPEVREEIEQALRRAWSILQAEDIADAIAYIVTRPRHVAINEVLVRPTEQSSDVSRPNGRCGSAVALDDAVGDEVEQLALLGVELGAARGARLAVGDHLERPGADPLQGAGGGDPVAERLGARRRRGARRSTSRMPGSLFGRLDQRQGDGAVEQVGAARLAGPLRRAG